MLHFSLIIAFRESSGVKWGEGRTIVAPWFKQFMIVIMMPYPWNKGLLTQIRLWVLFNSCRFPGKCSTHMFITVDNGKDITISVIKQLTHVVATINQAEMTQSRGFWFSCSAGCELNVIAQVGWNGILQSFDFRDFVFRR